MLSKALQEAADMGLSEYVNWNLYSKEYNKLYKFKDLNQTNMGDNPIDVFKEEMENEEVYLKVNAMHRVRVIATLLGVDKIKSVLLPYFECKLYNHLI